jgi:hypothetical protein
MSTVKKSVKKTTPKNGIDAGKEVMCETIRVFEEAGATDCMIAQELCGIGFADITDFIDVDDLGIVHMKPIDEWPEGGGHLVKRIKEKRVIRTEKGTKDKPDSETILDSTFEFELHDKLDALGKIISVKGIQKPVKVDAKHSGNITVNIRKFGKGNTPAKQK